MSCPSARESGLGDTSCLQRHLWRAGPQPAQVRALRLCGEIDRERLVSAIVEVTAAWEVLRVRFHDDGGVPVMVPTAGAPAVRRAGVAGPDRDGRCVALLRQDRDCLADRRSDPPVRFHVVDLGAGETVLGLVAHPLVLDVRSVYLALGAVMLAYAGRFRPAQYPSFARIAGVDPVSDAAVRRSRSAWWSHRLTEWEQPGPSAAAAGARSGQTRALVLGDDRWQRLTRLSGSGGNPGSLAVIALLAWWLRVRAGSPGPVFGTTLDLRDVLGLGVVPGPLTDRVVFRVGTDDVERLSFRDLLLRSHAALLDSVVHYLPYSDLVDLGVERCRSVGVNYCRLPPASSSTRGEATLADRGMSIELFCEADLVRAGREVHEDLELHLAESAEGMAVVVNFDPLAFDLGMIGGLLHDLDRGIDQVIANPDTMVDGL